jgi:Excalibur calcium-binding domain
MIRAVIIAGAIAAAAIGAAPTAVAEGPYANCTQAHKDGRWDIPQSDPDYWPGGDRDNDGIACES